MFFPLHLASPIESPSPMASYMLFPTVCALRSHSPLISPPSLDSSPSLPPAIVRQL